MDFMISTKAVSISATGLVHRNADFICWLTLLVRLRYSEILLGRIVLVEPLTERWRNGLFRLRFKMEIWARGIRATLFALRQSLELAFLLLLLSEIKDLVVFVFLCPKLSIRMKDHLQGDRKCRSLLNIWGNSGVDYYCSADKLC